MESDYLTPAQFARKIGGGVTDKQVVALCKAGVIDHDRKGPGRGGGYRIPVAFLNGYNLARLRQDVRRLGLKKMKEQQKEERDGKEV